MASPITDRSTPPSLAAPDRARRPRTRLPLNGLLALAAVVFTGVVTEILPAGLLPQMSADLGASESQIGQLVAIYAVTTAITAIPLTAVTRSLPRKPLLVGLVIGFALVNGVTAIADSYTVILIARMFGGMLAGLLWAMAAGYAMRTVEPEHSGRALSIAMVGTPLAFAFGLPIATTLGAAIGWRAAFGVIAVVGVGLAIWAAAALPSFPGERSGQRPGLASVLRMPGLVAVLATTGLFVLAHNIAYTYIAPITVASGIDRHLDLALLVFGVLAVIGVIGAGALVDRWMRSMVLVATALLGLAMIAIGLFAGQPVVVFVALAVWGIAYGSAPTLLQAAPARIAGDAADVAQSMVVATWNGAIAAGAFLGGLALDEVGVEVLPWLALALLAVAALIAATARAAFRPVRAGE
ncbi:putative MFS family arabinose efflux permease [Agromyces hippuratus]|uniref:Putative MFS family arabinose efflux permease n=1 Tax=Agromyces hippuratus TaxID=286438 RepID=A0A852X828_9MICO|nr:MFS transporter [Agromyces hippuratus]NYG22111.1 putative MFS family arabinose efflux permease [Agromyces hippuratus]